MSSASWQKWCIMPELTKAQAMAIMDVGIMEASTVASVSRCAREAIRLGWLPDAAICKRHSLHPYYVRWWRARMRSPSRCAQQNSGLADSLLHRLQQELDAGVSPTQLRRVHGVPVRWLVRTGALYRLPTPAMDPARPARIALLVQAGLASSQLARVLRISPRAARNWVAKCR